MPTSIESFISMKYGCLKFIDSNRLLYSSKDNLTSLLPEKAIKKKQKNLYKIINSLVKKLAQPYEHFHEIGAFVKPLKENKITLFFKTNWQKHQKKKQTEQTHTKKKN